MENLIIELSKYIIIILFAIYTLYCFTVFRNSNKNRQNRIFGKQRILIFLIHFICYMLLLLNTKEVKYVFFYLAQVAFIIVAMIIYQLIYKNLSILLLNNMLILFVVSFVMLARISYSLAVKQFAFACVGMGLCLFVPFIIDHFKYFDKLGWIYAMAGLIILLLVFVIGNEKNGAKNWVSITKGVGFQPSEFVKIIFVFFVAAILSKRTEFKEVVKVTAVAAVYVLILVFEKDLGAALIYFITYLSILYVATGQPFYLLSGLTGGSVAAVIAYKLFAHVRVRVSAWRDPWGDMGNSSHQISQSLFAIGTGGWFGLGLGKGLPTKIPVRESDFIFSAISEEMGGIFAVCLILVYISCFIMFVNIAMKIKDQFYKLTALGLSVIFIFQVFLTLGGATKLIPSTGVTLPLVSYGGSSILSTVILFSIIQGLYVLNQGKGESIEKGKKQKQLQ